MKDLESGLTVFVGVFLFRLSLDVIKYLVDKYF